MTPRWICNTLSACVLVSASAVWAQSTTTRFPDNEQLRHYRAMGAAKLSPDGKWVLFSVTDATADGGKTHLWLTSVDGGEPRQLTYSPDSDKQGERNGEWMPDGKSILFTAHRSEHTSIYRLPMDGGEAKAMDLKVLPMVDESKRGDAVPPLKADDAKKAAEAKPEMQPIDVASYRIAPDGKTIAIIARDPQTPGEKKERDAKADANWADHDPHGTRLYLLDVASTKLTATGMLRTCVRGGVVTR